MTTARDDSFVRGSTSHDGCVVPREQLATIIGSFVTTWQKRHPVGNDPSARGRASQQPNDVAALDWLAAEIDRQRSHDPAGRVTREMLNNIMREDTPKRAAKRHVDLRHADPILTALGETQALYDGRVRVLPNPRARKTQRLLCCRGSGFQDGCRSLPFSPPREPEMVPSYRQGYREGALTGALTGALVQRPGPDIRI